MVEILEMVDEGDLPFDRTMRISTAEEDAKGKIAARIPENLKRMQVFGGGKLVWHWAETYAGDSFTAC